MSLVVAGALDGAAPIDHGYTAGQEVWAEERRAAPPAALIHAAAHRPAVVLAHPDTALLQAEVHAGADTVRCAPELLEPVRREAPGAEAYGVDATCDRPLALPLAGVLLPWLRSGPAEVVAQVLTPVDPAPGELNAAAVAACAAADAPDTPHAPPLSHVEFLPPRALSPAEAVRLAPADPPVGWHAPVDCAALLAEGPAACDALALAGCVGLQVDLDVVAAHPDAQRRAAVAALGRRGIGVWASWTVGAGTASRVDIEAACQRVIALGCAGLRVQLPEPLPDAAGGADLGVWEAEPPPPRTHPVLEAHEPATIRDRVLRACYAAGGPTRLRVFRLHVAGATWAEGRGAEAARTRAVHAAGLRRLHPFARALERFAPTPAVAAVAAEAGAFAAAQAQGDAADREGQERFLLARLLRETCKRQRGSRGSEAPPADAWRLALEADPAEDPAATLRVEVVTDRAAALRIARNRARFIATAAPA